MSGLVQLWGSLFERVVGPDGVDDLLAVKSAPWRQREDFDQCCGVSAPLICGNRPAVDGDFEPAEHCHLHVAHCRPFTFCRRCRRAGTTVTRIHMTAAAANAEMVSPAVAVPSTWPRRASAA